MEFGCLQFVYRHASSNIRRLSQSPGSRQAIQPAGPGQPAGKPRSAEAGWPQLRQCAAPGGGSSALALPRTGSRAGSSAPVLKSGQHRGPLAPDQAKGQASAPRPGAGAAHWPHP